MPRVPLSCCSLVPSSKLFVCLLVIHYHFVVCYLSYFCSSPSRLSSVIVRLSIAFWLSRVACKVPVWVMRKTLASLASSAQAEWCLACSAATGLRDGWRGGPYRYRSEGSAVRRARGFLRPPRGERVICKPCGHVLLNYLGAARGRKCDYTKYYLY